MSANKRKNIGLGLMIAGIAALTVTILFWIFGSKLISTEFGFEPDQPMNSSDTADLGNLIIPGFESVTIPAGETEVPFRLYNPEKNPCYFEITITISDTDEEIYKSKLISPGQELSKITMNRELEKGSYAAVIHYAAYTTDGLFTPLNGADVPFTLIVG